MSEEERTYNEVEEVEGVPSQRMILPCQACIARKRNVIDGSAKNLWVHLKILEEKLDAILEILEQREEK